MRALWLQAYAPIGWGRMRQEAGADPRRGAGYVWSGRADLRGSGGPLWGAACRLRRRGPPWFLGVNVVFQADFVGQAPQLKPSDDARRSSPAMYQTRAKMPKRSPSRGSTRLNSSRSGSADHFPRKNVPPRGTIIGRYHSADGRSPRIRKCKSFMQTLGAIVQVHQRVLGPVVQHHL